MKVKNRIPELFESIDNQDMDTFLGFLDEDVAFRFGNMPEVQGKENVREAIGGFYDSIQSLSHQVDEVFGKKKAIACNGTVTYTRHDSSKLSVPFANIFKLNGKLIGEYYIYVDISELYK